MKTNTPANAEFSHGKVYFLPAEIDKDYAKKWNIDERGMIGGYTQMYKDGERVSDTLYREGGIGIPRDGYKMILKYSEALYSKEIAKAAKSPREHLAGAFCIINEEGEEKINFNQYASPYLQGGVVYVLDNNYHNIETGELIANAYKSISSDTYIFLNDEYNEDRSKRGVIRVEKATGKTKLYQ